MQANRRASSSMNQRASSTGLPVNRQHPQNAHGGMRWLLATSSLVGLAPCKPTEVRSTKPLLVQGIEAPAWVTIEHGTCYPSGHCPHYRLTVHGDGRVEYFGKSHVHTRGPRTASIDPNTATAALHQLAAIDVLAEAPECRHRDTAHSHAPRTRLEVIGKTDGMVVLCDDETFASARNIARKLEREVDAAGWVGTWYPCPSLQVGLRGKDQPVRFIDLGYDPAAGPASWAELFVRDAVRFGTAAIPGFKVTVTGVRTADEGVEVAERRAIETRDLLLGEGLDPRLMNLSTRVEEAPAFSAEVEVEIPGCGLGRDTTTTADRTRPSLATHTSTSEPGDACEPCDGSCATGQICGDAWVCIPNDCESDEDCPTSYICDASSSTCTTCCMASVELAPRPHPASDR